MCIIYLISLAYEDFAAAVLIYKTLNLHTKLITTFRILLLKQQ